MEITRIHPSQITVRIEELIEKSFSIKPRYQGTPKKGYLLGDIKIVPDTLTMRGPRSVLEKMEYISAHEIVLEGLNESTTMRVDLDLPGGNIFKNNRCVKTHLYRFSGFPCEKPDEDS